MLKIDCRKYLHTNLAAIMEELSFGHQLTNELEQKQKIKDCLINKILYSKRLLVDHIEVLENLQLHTQAMPITDVGGSKQNGKQTFGTCELLTARNTFLIFGGALLERFITPKAFRLTLIPSMLVAGSFGVVYILKNIFIFRNKIVERQLDNLIRTIDAFGNCLRRNMTYFNEVLIMKQKDLVNSRQIERAWDCITAAKEVAEILYDATRKLETKHSIPSRFSEWYSSMEELRDCEYFKMNVTDYSPKHIKDFYNIFAYVQSQFLLCLALAIATKPSISKLNTELVKIDCLIQQIVQDEENHFLNLSTELIKNNHLELEALNTTKTTKNRSGPVAMLQDCSLKLSARMVAVAGECLALDITLQRLTEAEAVPRDNALPLIEVANNMRSIENTLSVCCDDFQCLMTVYNKFMSSKLDNQHDKVSDNVETTTKNNIESFLAIEIPQNVNETELKDDFYAYIFDEQNLEKEPPQTVAPEYDKIFCKFEKRITKSKFKPVLKQLKDRINPIRQEMLEKERKVLAAKGINVDDLFAKEIHHKIKESHNIPRCDEVIVHVDEASSSGSDSSDDLGYQNRSKNIRKCDNYTEMRNFLAQKQPVNLFNNLNTPRPRVGNEVLLE